MTLEVWQGPILIKICNIELLLAGAIKTTKVNTVCLFLNNKSSSQLKKFVQQDPKAQLKTVTEYQ